MPLATTLTDNVLTPEMGTIERVLTMSTNTRTVAVGNGSKLGEFRRESCKSIRTAVWQNEGTKGTMTSVQLQKGYKARGARKWTNMNVTFLNRLEIESAIACLQGALELMPENATQNAGTAQEYTSV